MREVNGTVGQRFFFRCIALTRTNGHIVKHGMRAALLSAAVVLLAACDSAAPKAAPEMVAVTRSLGTWHGRGSQTIGIVSESGRLKVRWEARNEWPAGAGTFRLTLHSAVSGRPIQLIADHRGNGHDSADVSDDPRPYNLQVESANLDWSITVEEVVASPRRQ